MRRKLVEVVGKLGLGGVFSWGFGEDEFEFWHSRATTEGLEALARGKYERGQLRYIEGLSQPG